MPDDDRPLFEKPLEDQLPPDQPKVAQEPRENRDFDLPPRELVAIARLQKQLLSLIVLYLLAGVMVGGVAAAMQLTLKDGSGIALGVLVMSAFALVVWVLELIVSYRLACRLYPDSALALLLLSCFVRCLGVVVLLVLNAKATSTLRRNGIRVGLYGVREADLPKLERREPTTLPKLGW